LRITQIANAPFMRMLQSFCVIKFEFAFLNLIAYFFVGFSERNAFVHQFIHGFHAEQISVFWIIEDMLLYLQFTNHHLHQLQAGLQFFDGGEKNFLGQLHLAVIAGRKV